jgi:hypothetical protein
MTTRKQRLRSEKYHENITKRGKVEMKKKDEGISVGPIMLAFFLFVVVGSAIVQIIRGQ